MISSYLLLNDLRFHYLTWNASGDGAPIVLLHGLASNARIWELVAPHLAQAGLAPLAWDARGHGLTDKPETGYDFAAITGDLAAFLAACHVEKPILVGHSWGAHIALNYAAQYAIGPRAPAGIVLVDGGITQLDDAPDATWESISQRLAPPHLAGMPLEKFLERLKNWHSAWQPDDQIISIILANFDIYEDEESGVEKIAPHLSYEHHMQIVRAMWEFQTYEKYSCLRCPALAIPARPAEPLSPVEQGYLAAKERSLSHLCQAIPSMQVHWMADTIHDIPLQRPAELAALITNFVALTDHV